MTPIDEKEQIFIFLNLISIGCITAIPNYMLCCTSTNSKDFLRREDYNFSKFLIQERNTDKLYFILVNCILFW